MQRELKQWGFEHSLVKIAGEKYLERWILYVAGFTIRLHKFWRGDEERASHSHPWVFWTFPLTSYVEHQFCKGVLQHPNVLVEAFQFHYRRPSFEHRVLGSVYGKPFYTVVLTGRRQQLWGFYPEPGKFIPWWEWK